MREPKKVFLSGPVTSRPDTYKGEFAAAAELVERAGFIPLNPATLPQGMKPGDYMRITLAMLDTADMVLMLDGWERSDGANLEAGYAEYIKKPYLDMEHFKDWYFLPDPEPKPTMTVKPTRAAERVSQRRVERMFGPQETWPAHAQPEGKPEATPASAAAAPEKQTTWRGFLLLRCPHCGEIRGFCTKAAVNKSTCRSCGQEFPLGDLIPAHLNCSKCGSHFKYLTNIVQQEPISYHCINCQAPVDLQLNAKGTALVTLGDKRGGGYSDEIPFQKRPPQPWREMRDGR